MRMVLLIKINVDPCLTIIQFFSILVECADGTHTCHETAVCEDLFDMRGDPGSLTERGDWDLQLHLRPGLGR